jgi:nitrate/nitrite-specific signal transduction histidine kinase
MRANNNLYKRVIKPLKKLRKIEEQLEKGHLQEKKIEELLNEYDTLDREMKTCPEYRLYAFKKKRGIKIS